MKNKQNYTANFYDEGIFHVYNRTNNKELLFRSDENRLYFLRQYHKYLHPFLDTFCWNLLPNHFHFLVRIKRSEEIKKHLKTIATRSLKPIERKYLEGAQLLNCYWNWSGKDFLILTPRHLTNSIKGRATYSSGHLKEWK